MGAYISFEGIKYRFKRHFRSTAYDQEKLKRNKTDDVNENPDKDISKAIVQSLQVNAVSDLPIFLGVRYVELPFLF
jgi:hypothetical protein